MKFGDLEPTNVIIQLGNRRIVHPLGILEDMLVQVNELIFPIDVYVLDMEDESSSKGSILILRKLFLMTIKTKIDVRVRTFSMEFGDNMRKLDQATRKDNFPLPFIDQVLERLVDGFSSYMQIHIALEDQHKPSPAYLAPLPTLGCCFSCVMYQVPSRESRMEVFMDDFMVYGLSFDACLESFSGVLDRCIETNLVLNFEKCHFMVVLGHLVSNRGIEVDKAKFDIIASLSHPTFVRKVGYFLGHVGFYKRFIQNFSTIPLPLS
ncbi:Retrovirus-related Pol polyprotein from transposon 17.6, partial [Mucuna pruriens]